MGKIKTLLMIFTLLIAGLAIMACDQTEVTTANPTTTASTAAPTISTTIPTTVSTEDTGSIQTINYDDGKIFEGVVVDGKANGAGVLTNPMGSVWTGTFIDDILQGLGTFISYDYSEYEGFFVDGVFSGYGHMIYSNGDEYWGMFENGKKNGVGRMEFTTLCNYEGGWVNNSMHGMGWMTWPVGDAYFGQWENGNPQGFGCKVFYDAAFCVKDDYFTYNMYVGGMTGNQPDGWGMMRFAEHGGIYIGNWDLGTREDTAGMYIFEEDSEFSKFIGSFSKSMNSGWIWGEGTMYYKNGLQITGVFENTECVDEYSRTYYDFDAGEYVVIENLFLENNLVQAILSLEP